MSRTKHNSAQGELELVPNTNYYGFGGFSCEYCAQHNNLVSGQHSHKCFWCGEEAVYGWYTHPLCSKHYEAIKSA